MRADEFMHSPVVTIRQDVTVAELCDVLQQAHVNGMPVVDDDGDIVGIVTEEDVLYGAMGASEVGGGSAPRDATLVRDIMTSPAVCATEDTSVLEICQIMWRMRIHRVPIVRDGKVLGIVSAMDLVRAVAEGSIRL